MRTTFVLLAAVAILLATVSPAITVASGVKLVSSGEFTDRDGAIHSWRVNGSHTLLWEGRPYMPVGGVFCSRYVSSGQTEQNWQADVKALELIKSKGITDFLVRTTGPASLSKPDAWQKLIDYLDQNGFTYGIDLADGPQASLSGYLVDPARYKVTDITKDAKLTFNMPDISTGLWMLCSAGSGEVLSSGGAMVAAGKVKVDIRSAPDQSAVLILYPEKTLSGGDKGGTSDVWTGFDEYRDRLVAWLGKIKFGKGLRFFADPIASKADLTGELSSLIPDSTNFRLEFESYLAKKYQNVGSVNSAWGVKDKDIKSFQQAARLIPLWWGAKGIPAVYDRANGRRYDVDPIGTKIWTDLLAFRDSSTQTYMNAAADIVKRSGANVPVIYKALHQHKVYVNSVSRGGFDGLGVESYGHALDLITASAGPAFSMAEEAARSTWFVVTGTGDNRRREKPGPGYPSESSMLADLDYFREIGAKGVFVNALQDMPDKGDKSSSMVGAPEQLDWLKSFKDKFVTDSRADYLPKVIFYPSDPVVGASITRLEPDTWWLPSLRGGARVDLGETVGAYTAPGQDGICMWSRTGPATLTFSIGDGSPPVLAYPTRGSDRLKITQKKKAPASAVLNLDFSPIIVTGLDPVQAFPSEMAEAAITKLSAAIAKAKSSGNSGGPSADTVKNSEDVLKNGRARIAFDMAESLSSELLRDTGTYAWIEAEYPVSNNFDAVGSAIGASQGACLSLNNPSPPIMAPYSAAYWIPVTKEVTHQFWIACTTAESGPSPFSFSIDNGPWQSAALQAGARPYFGDFAWYMIGSANLTKGQHSVQIRVDGPGSGGAYRLDIDCLVFSPSEFKPDGVTKP